MRWEWGGAGFAVTCCRWPPAPPSLAFSPRHPLQRTRQARELGGPRCRGRGAVGLLKGGHLALQAGHGGALGARRRRQPHPRLAQQLLAGGGRLRQLALPQLVIPAYGWVFGEHGGSRCVVAAGVRAGCPKKAPPVLRMAQEPAARCAHLASQASRQRASLARRTPSSPIAISSKARCAAASACWCSASSADSSAGNCRKTGQAWRGGAGWGSRLRDAHTQAPCCATGCLKAELQPPPEQNAPRPCPLTSSAYPPTPPHPPPP